MLKRYLMRFAIGLTLFGVFGFFDAIQVNRENKAFRDHAVAALAVPAGVATKGQSYQGDLVFSTESGETRTIPVTKVPSSIRDSLGVVSSTKITYLPEEPKKVRFSDWDAGEERSLTLPVLMFFLGLVTLGLWAGAFRR